MIIALIALFVTLSGTASAAGNLITGIQVKDHSIGLIDLSKATVAALHGTKGDPGAQGDRGPLGDTGPQVRVARKVRRGREGRRVHRARRVRRALRSRAGAAPSP